RESREAMSQATNKPSRDFGICLGVDDILERARETVAPAKRFDGEALSGTRPIVAMCGVAATRKGADLFYEAATQTPDVDFLWVGPWDDEIARNANPVKDRPMDDQASNFYYTNLTQNPYAHIAKATLFLLTSREDPNPLVVPEALLLDVPTVSFTRGTGAHLWTSRFGTALSGAPEAARIAKYVERFLEQ